MSRFNPTPLTTVKRLPKRAAYDEDTVFGILDEGFLCHVGFVVEGRPVVIPTLYGRIDDRLYLHGSAASRMLRNLAEGVEVCVTVTLVDGLVLARSAFHTSMNYRSVVIFGKATVVEGEEKLEALRAFSEHVIAGRWAEIRGPSENELKGTLVLCLPIEQVSAKVRTGGPLDDDEDYALPVWAGVIPMGLAISSPVDDDRLLPGLEAPAYVREYARSSPRPERDIDPE